MPTSYSQFSAAMRTINGWAGINGYRTGFLTGHLPVGIETGDVVVEATLFFQGPYVRVEDVSREELNLEDAEHTNIGVRFRKANDYARVHGCFGFPNFHQRRVGNTIVYGTVLIRELESGVGAKWRDVPISSLGNSPENHWVSRFKRTHEYAIRQPTGPSTFYEGGYPNGHQANYGAGVVNGTILVPRGGLCENKHIPLEQLPNYPYRDPFVNYDYP